MTANSHQCQATVYGYPAHQCSRRGVVERNSRWYCKQHDPQPKWEARKAVYARNEALDDLRDLHRQRREVLESLVTYLHCMDTISDELARLRDSIDSIDKQIADVLPRTR